MNTCALEVSRGPDVGRIVSAVHPAAHSSSCEARPGGRFTERWADAGGRAVVTSGRVVLMDAPRTLELTWADEDWDEPTRVLFQLEEAADDTMCLTLEPSGWEVFPSPAREELVRAHASGWSRHVASLQAYSAGTPR